MDSPVANTSAEGRTLEDELAEWPSWQQRKSTLDATAALRDLLGELADRDALADVARYIGALLEREPVYSGRWHEAHRLVLASLLASMTRLMAEAGTDVPRPADLRPQWYRVRERELHTWAERQQ